MALRIGVSSCFFHADPKRPIFKGKTLLYLEESLAHWIMSEGAIAYLIPSVRQAAPSSSLRAIAQDLDGLVLQGGSDVSPKSYGETPLKPEWSGDYVRDQYEIELAREFMGQKKPVLGVCRGAQLLNVAFGGTLIQDIGTQLPQANSHREWEVYDQLFHPIRFEKDSGLAKLFPGLSGAKVNTVHHQAVKDLGKNLRVEARSEPDGVIEAIRGETPSYVFAVQWHPEFHDSKDATILNSQPILADFLREAAAHKA